MSRISAIVASVDDTQKEVVPITAWGVEVLLKGMTLAERSIYVQNVIEAREGAEAGNPDDIELLKTLDARVVIAGTYDPEDGQKVFSAGDFDMLATKAPAVVSVLAGKILRLSGLDGEAEKRLGKGFSTPAVTAVPVAEAPPSDDSSSPSPES